MGDEAGLFMQLTREEVHTKVAVLAGLCRRADANDLADVALQHEKVADADVVRGNRNRIWTITSFRIADRLVGGAVAATARRSRPTRPCVQSQSPHDCDRGGDGGDCGRDGALGPSRARRHDERNGTHQSRRSSPWWM